jgi:YNFM family putative membrane transporter
VYKRQAWNLRACLRATGPKKNSQSPSATILFGFTQYRKAFTTQGMPLFLALTFFQGAVNFAGMSFVPSFVHDHFGVSLTLASLVVVCFALGGFVYSRTARFLLVRFTVSQLALTGGLFQAMSFGSMVLVPSWSTALFCGFIGGFGATMFHNSLQTQATKMVPGSTGTSVSTFAMTLFMGQAIGVSAIATIFTSSASKAMFVLCACSILLAIAVYLRFRLLQKPGWPK